MEDIHEYEALSIQELKLTASFEYDKFIPLRCEYSFYPTFTPLIIQGAIKWIVWI
jgi:hypothetical protein